MIKVLVVDDSVLLCERISDFLSTLPEVSVLGSVTTPTEALDKIAVCRPDVVILDLHLSGGSGIEVLEGIRGDKEKPNVIVLTNFPETEYRQKCLEYGASAFLDKTTEFGRIPDLLIQLSDKNHTETNQI